MDKIFSVIGIAKSTLIIRGGCFLARQRFQTNLTEKELDSFKDYIEILECKEQVVEGQKQEPIAEKVETIIENPKEEITIDETISNTKESTEEVEEEIKPKENKENGLSKQSSRKGKGTNKTKV